MQVSMDKKSNQKGSHRALDGHPSGCCKAFIGVTIAGRAIVRDPLPGRHPNFRSVGTESRELLHGFLPFL